MQNHKRWKDWKDMKIHERTNPNIWRYWRSYAESTDSTPINLLVIYPFKPVGCGGSLGWLCRGSSNSFKNGRTSSTDRPTALAASATNSCKCLRQTSHSQQWQSSFHKLRVGMWSQGHACRKCRVMAVVRVNVVYLKDCGKSTDKDHTSHVECWGSTAWKLAWRMPC